MAHFWLSHVPRPEIGAFMKSFFGALVPGSSLLVIDTKWVEGYRHPIARRDTDGNTYHLRTLKDGSQYEILKNYYTRDEWMACLEPFGTVSIQELSYIWLIRVDRSNSPCT
jgi:demethylmenaquinone methyltransferase/2-methoxy-6-polyprenyl-1,4-benzoquinol methylase